jgi:hypothetical protein
MLYQIIDSLIAQTIGYPVNKILQSSHLVGKYYSTTTTIFIVPTTSRSISSLQQFLFVHFIWHYIIPKSNPQLANFANWYLHLFRQGQFIPFVSIPSPSLVISIPHPQLQELIALLSELSVILLCLLFLLINPRYNFFISKIWSRKFLSDLLLRIFLSDHLFSQSTVQGFTITGKHPHCSDVNPSLHLYSSGGPCRVCFRLVFLFTSLRLSSLTHSGSGFDIGISQLDQFYISQIPSQQFT